MSHMRYDLATHDWIIIAPERAGRPHEHSFRPEAPAAAGPCPFCPGHEEQTDVELLRVPDPADPAAWSVRVMANKYPALTLRAGRELAEKGRHFQEVPGYGSHEVVVESPRHDLALAFQPQDQVERLLGALQARYRELLRAPGLKTLILFKNHGAAAGTSLRHPHWQILATAMIPRLLRLKATLAREYHDREFRRLHHVLLQEELAAGERVLARNHAFAAVLPYASHLAYQIRILPLDPASAFSRAGAAELAGLASLLRETLGRLHASLRDPAFNLTLVTPPVADEEDGYFHWHIDIYPRLYTGAGLELGSGMTINPVPPERARDVLLGRAPAPEGC